MSFSALYYSFDICNDKGCPFGPGVIGIRPVLCRDGISKDHEGMNRGNVNVITSSQSGIVEILQSEVA